MRKVVYFGANQVFDNSLTITCLLFLSGSPQKTFELIRFYKNPKLEDELSKMKAISLSQSIVTKNPWNFHDKKILKILDKLKSMPNKLSDITRKIFVGLQTSADDIYVLDKINESNNIITVFSKSLGKEIFIEKGFVKAFLIGRDVSRYVKPQPKRWVIFPYNFVDSKAHLYTQKEIQEQFPLVWDFLLENKKALQEREHGVFKKE